MNATTLSHRELANAIRELSMDGVQKARSEERRVGKGGRKMGSPSHVRNTISIVDT